MGPRPLPPRLPRLPRTPAPTAPAPTAPTAPTAAPASPTLRRQVILVTLPQSVLFWSSWAFMLGTPVVVLRPVSHSCTDGAGASWGSLRDVPLNSSWGLLDLGAKRASLSARCV